MGIPNQIHRHRHKARITKSLEDIFCINVILLYSFSPEVRDGIVVCSSNFTPTDTSDKLSLYNQSESESKDVSKNNYSISPEVSGTVPPRQNDPSMLEDIVSATTATKNSKKQTREKTAFDFELHKDVIKKWTNGGGKYNVCCLICVKYPDTVRRYQLNRRPPQITLSAGTQNRANIIEAHLHSIYHKACVERFNREKIENADKGIVGKPSSTPLEHMISSQNAAKANTISRYLMSTYIDGKQLTSSAYSWPARMLVNEYGQIYQINQPEKNEEALQKLNLQYLTPNMHAELMECIVDVERNVVRKKIENGYALSLRADGSIDCTNIDKIYVLAKIINDQGELETLFLGVAEQTERGALGLLATIKKIVGVHGEHFWKTVLKKMSSFVTDGASVNIGEHKGLWRLIDIEAEGCGANQHIMKIWCAAHRSDLAMKDLNKHVLEVPKLIQMCSNISTFIRRSAVRLAQLKKIAIENDLALTVLPRYFEIRWSEFTSQLVMSTLISWRSLVLFLKKLIDDKDEYAAQASGYLKFLTTYDNVQMLAFLADLFFEHANFQKKAQCDHLNIMSLSQIVQDFQDAIFDMKANNLIFGWEETLTKSLIPADDGSYTLKGIVLVTSRSRTASKRTFQCVRDDVLEKFGKFIAIRFSSQTDKICEAVRPFFELKLTHQNVQSMKSLHEISTRWNYICNLETSARFLNSRRCPTTV